jgi:hypothetical protein
LIILFRKVGKKLVEILQQATESSMINIHTRQINIYLQNDRIFYIWMDENNQDFIVGSEEEQ